MSIYDRPSATAKRMLTKFGQHMTLTQRTPGSYDPSTGTGSETTTGETVRGAIFDFPLKMIDGTLIRQGDKQVLLAASGMTLSPEPGMTLTDAEANVYTVVSAQPLNPAGTAVIHTLQVRTA